jgi:hypothetical protein
MNVLYQTLILNSTMMEICTDYSRPFTDCVNRVGSPIFNILFFSGILIGIFYAIFAYYNIMSSKGDPGKKQSGIEQLTSVIIGMAFLFGAVAIYNIIKSSFFNV